MQIPVTTSQNINSQLSDVNIIRKSSNISLMLFSIIIGSLNVLFITNYTISMIIVGIELIILIYYFIKRDITKYIGNYLIFLCLSFEFDALVGSEQFYGFKNFRILGVNLGIIALLPVLILFFFKKIRIKKLKEESRHIYDFVKIIGLLNATGLIFGLFQILVNDNNIQEMNGMLSSFIDVSYNMIVIPFIMIVALIYIITWENDKFKELENYLIAILIAVVISMIVSLVSRNYGVYGGVNTLLVSNVVQYIPFMLLFPIYESHRSKKILFIFGIIGGIMALMYNATGKVIILYFIIPIAICGIFIRKKKILPVFLLLLVLPAIIILCMKSIENLANSSILFNSKMTEILSMLKFWESNWLINMPLSPRTRIVEFINIIYEYLEKPWFILFGKGYMGTFTDYTRLLSTVFVPSAYSTNQWANGTFFAVHEALNILFLYNGLLGVAFYLYMIKTVLKNFTKSPWILIGGYWILIIYGFSFTMSTFGIASLMLGYYEVDKCLPKGEMKE